MKHNSRAHAKPLVNLSLKNKNNTRETRGAYPDDPQPRFQGLSSSCPRERERGDPGWGWSRVSQNLGDYKQVTGGRGGWVSVCLYQVYRERENMPQPRSTCDLHVFQRSCQVVIQKPLKRYIKRVNLWLWAAIDFANQLKVQVISKSFTAKGIDCFWSGGSREALQQHTYFHEVNFCLVSFVDHSSKDQIILESSSTTISESQASFKLKVKRCIEESSPAPHTLKNLKAVKNQTWPEMCLGATVAAD